MIDQLANDDIPAEAFQEEKKFSAEHNVNMEANIDVVVIEMGVIRSEFDKVVLKKLGLL